MSSYRIWLADINTVKISALLIYYRIHNKPQRCNRRRTTTTVPVNTALDANASGNSIPIIKQDDEMSTEDQQ